jgi:hypothetical protein
MKHYTRRSFIISGVLAVGGSIAGVKIYESRGVSPKKRLRAVHGVIENLAKLAGAVRFGDVFREQQQKNNNPLETIESISRRLHKIHGDFRQNTIGEALEQQIQMELQTNQLQLVDNWFLARTEADLFALASLASKSNN